MKYLKTKDGEDIADTIKALERKEKFSKENYKTNLAYCEIYMRGQVWVIEKDGVVFYYETHNEGYPFFENALHFMNSEKRACWKTVGELVTFRHAIREATVQGTSLVENILEEEKLTHEVYRRFIRLARAHDVVHHGSNTF